jgi:hypothetical protein
LTPDQIKYFDDMERLFGSQGWKNFVEDIDIRQKQEREDLLQPRQTTDGITQAYGRSEVYRYILTLQTTLADVKAQLEGAEYE